MTFLTRVLALAGLLVVPVLLALAGDLLATPQPVPPAPTSPVVLDG